MDIISTGVPRMSSNETIFDTLKQYFGPEGDAQDLTFSEFVALLDDLADNLLRRSSVTIKVAGSLSKLRQEEKARLSSVTGK